MEKYVATVVNNSYLPAGGDGGWKREVELVKIKTLAK